MRKQSNLITILTLICSVCSLILSLMAFIRADNTATVVDLRNQNIQLQSQIDKLSNRLGSATESSTYAISDAYCNLLVESFREEGVNLILDKGYMQLQMPQPTTDCLTVRRAELVLMMDGSEMYQQDITLQEGEGEGGYETVLKNVSLPLLHGQGTQSFPVNPRLKTAKAIFLCALCPMTPLIFVCFAQENICPSDVLHNFTKCRK